ncbi:macrophage colony-stimulating factor 1b isoform X4 [Hypomesus transpacificus]|uniref:macrophage colony-stimulating factor 1b isoform X4 n=1 Tax=Hypomesus transpacificus TaxID=137520 RepID=UPI001F084DDE|nr:macrophage colony-stimulating factor 1b isoform X4 [Hypomesus transpacificus]
MTLLVPSLIQCPTKVKCLSVIIFLSFSLAMGEIPGPCRHSITKEHMLTLKHLIDNQLRSGCWITYTFIDQKTLDDPVSFEVTFRESPSVALARVQEILSVYWELVTTSNTPVDWDCQREYAESSELATHLYTSPTELSTQLSSTTVRSDMNSKTASQTGSESNKYKFGFIVVSLSGGGLLVLILCIITQRKYFSKINTSHSIFTSSLPACLSACLPACLLRSNIIEMTAQTGRDL